MPTKRSTLAMTGNSMTTPQRYVQIGTWKETMSGHANFQSSKYVYLSTIAGSETSVGLWRGMLLFHWTLPKTILIL